MQTLHPVTRAIGHDPDLFKLACSCVETTRSRDQAAREFLATLLGAGITKTPDGYRFSYDAVLAAVSKL